MKALFFKKILIFTLVFFGCVSFFFFLTKKQTAFIANGLELTFFAYASCAFIWVREKIHPKVVVVGMICVIYTGASYLYAVVYKGANLLDFLMIYKSFVYLLFLTFLTNKRLMTLKNFFQLFYFLMALFFMKYLVMAVLRLDDRPIVYVENNFELMLLYAFFLIRYSVTKEKYIGILVLLGLITLLSLSRASLLMYSILVLYVIYTSFKKTWIFIIPVMCIVLGFVVNYIFTQRSGSLEEIDRYKFFLVFLDQVKEWNLWNYIFGAERITPLDYYSCKSLGHFRNLFSFSGNGTCYSVILHSFLLRVILDHGFLGLFFIIYATYVLLRSSGVGSGTIWVFITIVLVNGLSVSSFNNLFFAISMVVLMTANYHNVLMKKVEVPKGTRYSLLDRIAKENE